MRGYRSAAITTTVLLAFTVAGGFPLRAYSVLTHEAVIDSVWESHLKPLLRARFPKATEDELREAHAYVYGGSLAADMGYAPMSSHFFSDLMHYVRSGDIVETLLRDAQTPKEYGFALGTLAHYVGDTTGHPFINRITPVTYPKLAAKFGSIMTFEDNHGAHLKTEFGLDVLQVARGKYAPDSYRDFIGFEIDQAGLDRAFQKTYGLKLSDVMRPDIAIGVYRLSVGKIIPEMTKVAWDEKKKEIERLAPEARENTFRYFLTRQEYQRQWGHKYKKPGIRQRFLAIVLKIVPPIGPFKALHFRMVPESGEKLFLQAFDQTVAEYRRQLEAVRSGRLQLSNKNLDTGEPVHTGAYPLADKTYAKLAKKLDKKPSGDVPESTRSHIRAFAGAPASKQ